jgi:hypothetical protein
MIDLKTHDTATRLRELCDALDGIQIAVDFADVAPLLREAADQLIDQRLLILKMHHCVQSTWRCLPEDIVSHFANDETTATENRLPKAIAWMIAKLPPEE